MHRQRRGECKRDPRPTRPGDRGAHGKDHQSAGQQAQGRSAGGPALPVDQHDKLDPQDEEDQIDRVPLREQPGRRAGQPNGPLRRTIVTVKYPV